MINKDDFNAEIKLLIFQQQNISHKSTSIALIEDIYFVSN